MPEYHLLRETPENSGKYSATGEVLRGSLQEAADEAVRRCQAGTRTAIFVYEALNKRVIAPEPGRASAEASEPAAEVHAHPPAHPAEA